MASVRAGQERVVAMQAARWFAAAPLIGTLVAAVPSGAALGAPVLAPVLSDELRICPAGIAAVCTAATALKDTMGAAADKTLTELEGGKDADNPNAKNPASAVSIAIPLTAAVKAVRRSINVLDAGAVNSNEKGPDGNKLLLGDVSDIVSLGFLLPNPTKTLILSLRSDTAATEGGGSFTGKKETGPIVEDGTFQDVTAFLFLATDNFAPAPPPAGKMAIPFSIWVMSDVDVPEPASALALGIGLVGLAVVRRSRRA